MQELINSPIAVLNLPTQDVLLIPFAEGFRDALASNTKFPNPDPTILFFTADIDAYKSAQALAVKKGQGAATVRNGKRRKVVADLKRLCSYVQSVIDTLPPDDAVDLILSLGLSIRQRTKLAKAALSARNSETSGEVLLDAKAVAAVAMYYWQYSLDQKVWINVPEMMKASAVISGLTPLTTYYFRFRATTRKGSGAYSQVVSLLVL